MVLTLREANLIAQGALGKARDLDIRINVAVCDAGGRLLSFQRMDGAMWAGVSGSQGKAMASAAFGKASGELTERANHPTLRGISAAEGNRLIKGQGAVPVIREGCVVGASGVGGGTAEEDEICAYAGVNSL